MHIGSVHFSLSYCPTPGIIVWAAIGYTSRSPLLHIYGTLNNAHYISGVLRSVVLPFIRTQRNTTFQSENARPYGADIVQIFLDTENVWL
ncbi:transposable element Tcb1 transposase [Trichonephila clavipes]|nr:transposable element Tcb1 transposase [Trichonephila clavipes]